MGLYRLSARLKLIQQFSPCFKRWDHHMEAPTGQILPVLCGYRHYLPESCPRYDYISRAGFGELQQVWFAVSGRKPDAICHLAVD